MEKLFSISMSSIMLVLLATFIVGIVSVLILALRNRIMAKLGLRNIPRRWSQTVLIIIGIMLSTVIMSAALGTGDTISYSIRSETLKGLGNIDEVVVYAKAGTEDSLGTSSYVPMERFEQIESDLDNLDTIDGLTIQIAETAPTIDIRTSLSEGQMRIVGLDPTRMDGFKALTLKSGGEVGLEDLAQGETYINERGAKELDAVAGDQLRVELSEDSHIVTVKAIVKDGGLAGFGSTLIFPLGQAQQIFDQTGKFNLVVVSNRGDELAGEKLSEDVTRRLRVLFTSRDVATQIKVVLNQAEVLKALEMNDRPLMGDLRDDISTLQLELPREELSDRLISLLADDDVINEVLDILDQRIEFLVGMDVDAEGLDTLREAVREISTQFQDLREFLVLDFKHDALGIADDAGSAVTSLFIVMSMFSIMVGILLIFLIFVMLAAARRSEMGMARAVGANRGHLIKMFLFEGTAYALVSAAVGVALGLGVSSMMVFVINQIISTIDADFQITSHFTVRSAIVAYCLGMTITFATIAFSSYRVSRLNIVMAIRDLPEALLPTTELPFGVRLAYLPVALFRPLVFLFRALWALRRRRIRRFLLNAATAVLLVVIPPIWIAGVVIALFRFAWPYLLRGWLTSLLGFIVAVAAASGWIPERDSLFGGGVSLILLGAGLMLRAGLKRTSLPPEMRDRIAFSGIGIGTLVFWALPPDTFHGITGDLQGDFDVMFISGIFMVTAAVWAVMFNADLLMRVLTRLTGGFRQLRPVIVMAVAYPMAAKFRTGLTLAMFALVIFSLMVISVLTASFNASLGDNLDTVVGGWQIQGSINISTPIEDMRQAIVDEPRLGVEDFEAIGGFTQVGVEVRQVGGNNRRWEDYAVRAADDGFLDAANYELKFIAEGYGPTAEDVWQALKEDPSLTVVEGIALQTREGEDFRPLKFDDLFYGNAMMSTVDIEVREPLSGQVLQLKVIAVLDRIHESFEEFNGMLVSKSALDNALPFQVPIATYQFKLIEEADLQTIAKDLEASFLDHGMESQVLKDLFEEGLAAFRAFLNIFIGFMGLGLVVGVAALGVVSTRAVVERRQQIGVLRAIGFRRRMVQLSFLIESFFIALLGTAIGMTLGLLLSYTAIRDIRAEEASETLRWVVPWLQIGVIILVTYVFSLLATYLPARQASRIYPAEALRYE